MIWRRIQITAKIESPETIRQYTHIPICCYVGKKHTKWRSCSFSPSSRCGYTPDSPDSCGLTPFMEALTNGHLSVARMLLEQHQVEWGISERKCFSWCGNLDIFVHCNGLIAVQNRRVQQQLTCLDHSHCTRLLSLARMRRCGSWCRT